MTCPVCGYNLARCGVCWGWYCPWCEPFHHMAESSIEGDAEGDDEDVGEEGIGAE